MEDEKDYWEKLYPKVVRTEHPGPKPSTATADEMLKWEEKRKAFNKSLFAERKHMVAVCLDEITPNSPKTPVEKVVMILGVSYLRDEFSDKDDVNIFTRLNGYSGIL
jgi:hypothetical protein